MRRVTRSVLPGAVAPILAAALSVLALGAAGLSLLAPVSARAAGSSCSVGVHRVGLVIEHSNGSVLTVCVGFDGSSVTGEQVLADSGVQYAIYSSGGDFLCQLDGEPAGYSPGTACYSQPYWNYFVSSQGSSWEYAQQGIQGQHPFDNSNETITDGDSVGFRYQDQQNPAPTPPGPYALPPANPPPTAAPTAAPGVTPNPAHTGTPTAPGIVGGPASSASAASTTSASAAATPTESPAATEAPSPFPAFRSYPAVVVPPSTPGPPWPGLLAGVLGVALLARIVVVTVRRRPREPSAGLSR